MTAFSPGQSPPPVRMPTVLATAVLYRSTRCRRRAPAGASARVAERGDSAAATLVDPHPGLVRSLRTPVLTHTTGATRLGSGCGPETAIVTGDAMSEECDSQRRTAPAATLVRS